MRKGGVYGPELRRNGTERWGGGEREGRGDTLGKGGLFLL